MCYFCKNNIEQANLQVLVDFVHFLTFLTISLSLHATHCLMFEVPHSLWITLHVFELLGCPITCVTLELLTEIFFSMVYVCVHMHVCLKNLYYLLSVEVFGPTTSTPNSTNIGLAQGIVSSNDNCKSQSVSFLDSELEQRCKSYKNPRWNALSLETIT